MRIKNFCTVPSKTLPINFYILMLFILHPLLKFLFGSGNDPFLCYYTKEQDAGQAKAYKIS